MVDPIANDIVAQALKEAGVPARNIELPADKGDGNKPLAPTTGEPKGDAQGADLETQQRATPQAVSSKPESTETEGKPLTMADIEKALDGATRKFQSITDKRIAQLQNQFQSVSNSLNTMVQSKEDAELASLPEDEQLKRRVEKLEKGGRPPTPIPAPAAEQVTAVYQRLADMVDLAGLKIDDPRIDWAPDVPAGDFATGYARFKTSIKAALAEDTKKAIEGVKTEGNKELTKLRKQLGVDKVSTSGTSGKGTPDIDKLTPAEKIKLGFELERQQAQIQ
jgi:hypothetical protein